MSMGRKRIVAGKKAGRLVIKPRKAGEKVPRKLVLRDGTRLDVLIDERPMMNVVVDKVVTEHAVTNKYARNVVLFDRVESHMKGNIDMRHNIIDDADIRFVRGMGEQRLCLRRMSSSEVERLPKSVKLTDTPRVYYKAEPSINLKQFFEYHDWKKFLRLYLTEDIVKDERLVTWFKSVVVPLIPENWMNNSELSTLQFFNNHSILLTNSQTGKSELARIVGQIPTNEYTVAGLYGGMVKGVEIRGELSGYGLSFFDECTYIKNYDDGLLLPQLLTYLSHGTASRTLKEGVKCRGSKTVIFSSNPPHSEDILMSAYEFLRILSGFEYPEKIGSRLGSVLISLDFLRTSPEGAMSSYRDATCRLLDQIYRKFYYKRIMPLMKINMQWARSDLEEIENSYHKIAMGCPSDLVKNFILGLKLSIHKLKFGAIRSVILENLDGLVVGYSKKSFQKDVIEKEREQAFMDLVSINLESLERLSMADAEVEKSKEYAERLKAKFPHLSVRDIALFMDCPKSTVQDWLKTVGSGDAKK